MNTLYDDRLDGRIPPVYDQKAAMIEKQQAELRRNILELEGATLPPLTTAVEIARFTSHACTAFGDQAKPEQRKLLSMVLKNASWKDGELQTSLFDPFELVRRSNRANGNQMTGLPLRKSGFEIWLPAWIRTMPCSAAAQERKYIAHVRIVGGPEVSPKRDCEKLRHLNA